MISGLDITMTVTLRASHAGEAEYCFYRRPSVCKCVRTITEKKLLARNSRNLV